MLVMTAQINYCAFAYLYGEVMRINILSNILYWYNCTITSQYIHVVTNDDIQLYTYAGVMLRPLDGACSQRQRLTNIQIRQTIFGDQIVHRLSHKEDYIPDT